MSWLSFHEFETEISNYDALVRKTPDVDVFCSRGHWICPAQRIYAPGAQPFIWRTDRTYSAFMMINIAPDVICAMPLEIGWGLACPLIGEEPDRSVGALASGLARAQIKPDYVLVSGVVEGSALCSALKARFGVQILGNHGESCVRRVADLSGGMAGFLSRRPAKFRAELRRKTRQVQRQGVGHEFVQSGCLDVLMRRIVAVESESWKGLSEQGVNSGLPLQFYESLVRSLLDEAAFRAVFVQLDGRDIAFAFGGVEGTTFRGLQLSFRDEFRSMAPGNYAQLQLVERLMTQGITRYDLGMDMPYKVRWAEQTQITNTRVIAV
jgi:hypothetical protein